LLAGIPGNANLANLVRDFKKSITVEIARIHCQRNFFDHRLRHGESEAEKFEYIRQNPVRAGLISAEEEWPYLLSQEKVGAVHRTARWRLRSIAPTCSSSPIWQ